MRRAALTLALAALFAAPLAAQYRVNKRADLAMPLTLGTGQGAIVIGFRRPDAQSAGKSAVVSLVRYDLAKRDMTFQPRERGARRSGDTKTYLVEATSGDRQLVSDYAVFVVAAGDYVLYGATPGPQKQVMNSFCLGAPSFAVAEGEVAYLGDFTPYLFVKLVDGTGLPAAMAFSSHPDEARAALVKQPTLAAALKPAALRNGATFTCAGQAMTAYEVPGAPALLPPEPAAQPAAATP